MTEWLVGADEAGRGSLVGEMIVSVAAVRSDCLDRLREMGVKDSKELSPTARASLYKEIVSLDCIVFSVQPVPPSEIDKRSLTILTEEAIAKAYSRVATRIGNSSVARFTVDRYGKLVKLRIYLRRLGYKGPIIIEERADQRYLEVATASIIAKYVRDARIRVLASMYGVEGSGYPSDPRTVDWVMSTIMKGEKPPIIRYSWGTLEGTGLRVKKEKKRDEHRITLDDFL